MFGYTIYPSAVLQVRAEGAANCSELVFTGAVPSADADVSGIGVIISFLLSAYLTFALVLGAYVFGYIDDSLLRPVDKRVHGINSRRVGSDWYEAIRQCVLLFSDQQIMVGIAILIAGFIGLAGDMSVYHFQIVIYLSWMASSVHLSALTMLGSFLEQHKAVMGWRVAGMVILFLLMLVALVPTASNMWALNVMPTSMSEQSVGWGVKANCYFFQNHGMGINPDAPAGYILLLVSYAWKVGGLFGGPRGNFRRWARGPVEGLMERFLHRQAVKASEKESGKLGWRYCFVMAVYVTFVSTFELLSSFAASLHLSWIGLIFGTIQIAVPRHQNAWWNFKENTWGFGQIVPLVLLIQPLGAVLEHMKVGKDKLSSHDLSSGVKPRDPPLSPPPFPQTRQQSDMSVTTKEQAVWTKGLGGHVEYNNVSISKESSSDSDSGCRVQETQTKAQSIKMSAHFAAYEPATIRERPLAMGLHQEALFDSWLFIWIIVWSELFLTLISILVFILDAGMLGNGGNGNVKIVFLGCLLHVGVLVLSLVLGIPFSRIYR